MDFLINLLPESIRNLPTHMDFEGQKKAERTFQVIIVLFAVVGFGWGYVCQQFSQTVYILGAGFVLSCLITLPPWPLFRVKSLQWQKPRSPKEGDVGDGPSTQTTTTQKTKKKK